MTGFSAKSSNKSDSEKEINNNAENSENLTEELNKLNELLKSGALNPRRV